MRALKRLDDQTRLQERTASGPSFDAFVACECDRSPDLDGRSVSGWEKAIVAKNTKLMPAAPLRGLQDTAGISHDEFRFKTANRC